MNYHRIFTGLLCSFAIAVSATSAQAQTHSSVVANKALVKASYDNNFNRKDTSQVTQYINAKQYIQHSINGKDGVAPLIGFIENMKTKMPTFSGQNMRMIAEGDLVVSQTEESINGKPVGVSMDLYRIKDGKIIEHWDAVQNYDDKEPANDNGIISGEKPQTNSMLSRKRLRSAAHDYFKRTWGSLDASAIDQYVAPDMIQHNPQVANGAAALKALVNGLKQDNAKIKVEIARVLVDNDFAVVHAKWTDDSRSYAVFDVLRFNDRYQIVEHWDVFGEKIPADNKNPRDPVF
jgi:predicted SnoaL-like aldol condensation-catalyzing enzyme